MMGLFGRCVVFTLCCLAGWAWAQNTPEKAGSNADKSRTRASASAKTASTSSKPRREPARKATAVAAAASVVPSEVLPGLEPELIALADQVHLGQIACELGQNVVITPDEASAGRFYMHHNRQTYHLAPVMSQTGALRLEDSKKGAVWIQLSNKSMLMNSQLGQRLADECQSPAQAAVAQAMKLAPPINLLEGGRDVARQ